MRLPRRPRGGAGFRHSHFTIEALYRLLTNRAYIGNPVFKTKDGEKEVNATWAAHGNGGKIGYYEHAWSLKTQSCAQVFFDQILRLQKQKEEYVVKISAIKADEVSFDSALSVEKFEKFTKDLKRLSSRTTDPNLQASICRKLISRVEVSTTGISMLDEW